MNTKKKLDCRIIFTLLVLGFCCVFSRAETIYVDSDQGNDTNNGTKDKPVRTIARAAAIVNDSNEPGPTTIRVAPGVYVIDKIVTFENQRSYTPNARLTIEASVLPDDSKWKPTLMPVVLFTIEGHGSENERHAPGLITELSHVTIRGLKFLGDPRPRTCTYPIYRWGKDLKDLLVTQCLFVGNREAMPWHCSICTNGHGLVVDHCVFYNCKIPVIFWNAEGGVSRGNAMKYCIVDGADIAAVWTCQTAEDFEFHHNIVTRGQYFWMRAPNNRKKYRISNCVVTYNKYDSGYGTAAQIFGQTGPEVTFEEKNVIKEGDVKLEKALVTPEALRAYPNNLQQRNVIMAQTK